MNQLDHGEPQLKPWALYVYLCGDNKDLAPHTLAQIASIRTLTGFEHLHIAVQWDLPAGARRGLVPAAGEEWIEDDLGRRNTGDPDELTAFLGWAIERCPATHVALVLSGTGLLDPRALVGQPGHDRRRIFTILDDSTDGDALEIASLRLALSKALANSPRQVIDLVAFDINELQLLEIAYELHGLVEVLVAPQTPIPPQGWDFDFMLAEITRALGANQDLSARELGRVIVDAAGITYQRHSERPVLVSALNLTRLDDVANAFDTMSLALMYSVGDELVWQARERVFQGLRPEASLPESARSVRRIEDDWLYDLCEMLSCLERELLESSRHGLATQLLRFLRRQDTVELLASIRSIDRAAFVSGSRLRFSGLKAAVGDPQGCRRALRQIISDVELDAMAQSTGRRARIDECIHQLVTSIGVPEGRGTWLEEWPQAAIDALEPSLRSEYFVASRSQHRARQIAQLTARVLRLLVPERATSGALPPLVDTRYPPMGSTASQKVLAGVSLFRPSDLDNLIASDYLKLEFNKRIHWTALLAVVNLIAKHPRALWRIVSGVLATADHATRSELLARITGPDSVIGAFRQQFAVLTPLSAMVLSLDPQAGGSFESDAIPERTQADVYRVRLERAGREALIEEATSVVDRRTVNEVMKQLVSVMVRTGSISRQEAEDVEALGRSLGEEILQGLGLRLEVEAKARPLGGIHLQLQIPRSLMQYPWELMQHRGGWISEHFALGRQVFTSGRAAPARSRFGGPLRALVIANPKSLSAGHLPYGQQEGSNVVALFERLRDETDGLLDFDHSHDAFVGTELTGLRFRRLLRERRYDIIHFAGHASFEPDRPELSSWQLSDGPLTAQTIGTTLDWSDTEPWLVFANACESGRDGESPRYQGDVYGLASAFLNQGVSAYIAPLWPIHDAVAADMAAVFYRALLKERQTAGESLRLARAEVKQKYYAPVLSEPDGTTESGLALLSWAGIVLYGNSTTTIGQRLGAPSMTDR